MYIHNTTFVVEQSVVEQFLNWAKETFLPAAKESGRFAAVKLIKILTEVAPGTSNYAIQMECANLDDGRQWHNDVAAILKDDLAARMGQRVLFFSTDMEILSTGH